MPPPPVTPPPTGGAGAGKKPRNNTRFLLILFFIALLPTGIWVWQMGALLALLENIGNTLPIPLGGIVFHWLPVLAFFAYGLGRAGHYSEPQPPYFLKPLPLARI